MPNIQIGPVGISLLFIVILVLLFVLARQQGWLKY